MVKDARLTPRSIKIANLNPPQAVGPQYRPRWPNLQLPIAAAFRHIQPQTQRIVMIKHSLQRTDQIRLAQTRRHL
jgi:hypothetical protein